MADKEFDTLTGLSKGETTLIPENSFHSSNSSLEWKPMPRQYCSFPFKLLQSRIKFPDMVETRIIRKINIVCTTNWKIFMVFYGKFSIMFTFYLIKTFYFYFFCGTRV
jgi:hypothetical protein